MATKPASTRRPQSSTTIPAVKPPCKIHPSAVIADKARLTGPYEIEIGENAIIHPYAEIKATHGKVIIGANSTVAERALVGITTTEATPAGEDQQQVDINIGEGVNIDVGAIVQASHIGDGTTIDVKAKVGLGVVIGRYCKIGPMEEVKPNEKIEDFTVIHSNGLRRVDDTIRTHPEIREAKRLGQEKTVELLKKLIPNAAAKWL